MMKIKVIFVEPEYELNIGLSARLLSNFGIKKMHLVNPKCSLGFSAKMYAKHAKNLVENAAIYKNLKDATKDCELIIGTTGIINKYKEEGYKTISIRELKEKINKNCKIALVFGRESIGLKIDEIKQCDLIVNIPTSPKYPILNITNSLAIFLYELSEIKTNTKIELAKKTERDYIKKLISNKIEQRKLKNKEKIKNVLFQFIERAFLEKLEAKALIELLK